jgi:gas vesicle protein
MAGQISLDGSSFGRAAGGQATFPPDRDIKQLILNGLGLIWETRGRPGPKLKGLCASHRAGSYNHRRGVQNTVDTGGNYMSDRKDLANQVGTAITFLLIGMGAGALIALLYAPKSGEDLRRDIRRKYKDAREAVEDLADEARDQVEDVLERGADWVEEVGKDARKRVAPLKRALQKD